MSMNFGEAIKAMKDGEKWRKTTLIIILISFLCACSTTSKIAPLTSSGLIEFVLVDTPEQLVPVCGFGKDGKTPNNGCVKFPLPKRLGGDNKFYLYSIKDWQCIKHEMDHVLFGNYHYGEEAECNKNASHYGY